MIHDYKIMLFTGILKKFSANSPREALEQAWPGFSWDTCVKTPKTNEYVYSNSNGGWAKVTKLAGKKI
jgi:hypothetical protein